MYPFGPCQVLVWNINPLNNTVGAFLYLLWHDPGPNGVPIIQCLGTSIVSVLESHSLAKVRTVIREGEWYFCPTNYVFTIVLRHSCLPTSLG